MYKLVKIYRVSLSRCKIKSNHGLKGKIIFATSTNRREEEPSVFARVRIKVNGTYKSKCKS